MKHEDKRDEAAQKLASEQYVLTEHRHNPNVLGGTFMDAIEEVWQDEHAAEYDLKDQNSHTYYLGLADMVVSVAIVQLDGIRERLAQQPGGGEDARWVQALRKYLVESAELGESVAKMMGML